MEESSLDAQYIVNVRRTIHVVLERAFWWPQGHSSAKVVFTTF
jgi:hypothetical protein